MHWRSRTSTSASAATAHPTPWTGATTAWSSTERPTPWPSTSLRYPHCTAATPFIYGDSSRSRRTRRETDTINSVEFLESFHVSLSYSTAAVGAKCCARYDATAPPSAACAGCATTSCCRAPSTAPSSPRSAAAPSRSTTRAPGRRSPFQMASYRVFTEFHIRFICLQGSVR